MKLINGSSIEGSVRYKRRSPGLSDNFVIAYIYTMNYATIFTFI